MLLQIFIGEVIDVEGVLAVPGNVTCLPAFIADDLSRLPARVYLHGNNIRRSVEFEGRGRNVWLERR